MLCGGFFGWVCCELPLPCFEGVGWLEAYSVVVLYFGFQQDVLLETSDLGVSGGLI